MKACLTLLAFLFLFSNPNLRADFVGDLTIAQIGDSVGASPTNRTFTTSNYDSGTITWLGDNGAGSRPTFARSGWTYRQMLNGGGGVDGLRQHVENPNYETPDVVYLLGGYNDVVQAPDDSDMANALADLVEILDLIDDSWGSAVYVANITNFPSDRQWAHKQSNVETLNNLIESEVAQRANTFLVDNNSLITDDLVRPDGLHINNDGQEVIGAEFGILLSVPEPNSICFLAAIFLMQTMRRRRQ